jgi:type III secretion system HrpE/YscL family protein
MSLLVLHRVDDEPILATRASRIERTRFAALRTADEALRAAQSAAQTMRDDTDQLLAAREQEARQAGFERGVTEAMVAVMGTLETERRLRQLLGDQIADVVEQTVRGMLGDLGPRDVFARRVRQLIRTASATSHATLHVAPAQAHLAREAIADAAQAAGGELTWLSLYIDEQCADDTLVLETRVGFVDASIDLTLSAARDAIGRAIQRAASRLGL